ncbi:hypothetical protein B0H17DRAFT_1131088 [Mycena rosella]|uniref:Uncharacterized protein n=1 Tax=Mycena rosella TaxID=1033263 RepID=A0AAD7DRY7_MYCRO|nr:hypothetical protein B0H17DRAFT_1131088 [Mycena rosella]
MEPLQLVQRSLGGSKALIFRSSSTFLECMEPLQLVQRSLGGSKAPIFRPSSARDHVKVEPKSSNAWDHYKRYRSLDGSKAPTFSLIAHRRGSGSKALEFSQRHYTGQVIGNLLPSSTNKSGLGVITGFSKDYNPLNVETDSGVAILVGKLGNSVTNAYTSSVGNPVGQLRFY